VVHFGAEKLNLLLCFFAFISHHLEVLECEFLTFTLLKPFQFGDDVFTPLFPEAIELTPTQDERIKMEHPKHHPQSSPRNGGNEMVKFADVVYIHVVPKPLFLPSPGREAKTFLKALNSS